LVGLAEGRAPAELAHAPEIVQQRRRQDDIRTKTLVQLRRLADERRDADRVLEQAAGVGVMRVSSGQLAQRLPERVVPEHPADDARQTRMRKLSGEGLEEAVELRPVAAHA